MLSQDLAIPGDAVRASRLEHAAWKRRCPAELGDTQERIVALVRDRNAKPRGRSGKA